MLGFVHTHAIHSSERLEALLHENRLEDILLAVSPREIAEAWNCYHRRGANSSLDDDWWAIEFWLAGSAVWENEEVVRAGLLALLDGVDDSFVGHVGAGPLEDFVSDDESRLAWIEERASTSERFRRAIAIMHVWGVESDSVAVRIERAARTSLPKPRSSPPQH